MSKPRARDQVFVSSTYRDLIDERQAAVEAILRAGHIPAGMELFAAQNKPQMEVIREWIEESDIFCLILGARYGSIEPESGKSYVESEYDHALARGKPIFSLVLQEKVVDANLARLGRKVVLEQDNEPLLKVFQRRITSTLVRIVTGPESIKVAVFEAITALEHGSEIDGWVRAKDARMSPQMGEELARLSAENARLTKELAAATRVREELIDGRTVRDWANLLATMSVEAWDVALNLPSPVSKVTLHGFLLKYGHELGAGVANSYTAGPLYGYLFQVASALISLGLAEIQKTPAKVHWQRIGLSASGKKLYAAFIAQQSRGDGVIAVSDLATAFLEADPSRSPKQTGTADAASAPDAAPRERGAAAPVTRATSPKKGSSKS